MNGVLAGPNASFSSPRPFPEFGYSKLLYAAAPYRGGHVSRRPFSRFAGLSWETVPDSEPQARKIVGSHRSRTRQNLKKTEQFRSFKSRFLRIC